MDTRPATAVGCAETRGRPQENSRRDRVLDGVSPKILILTIDHGASHRRVANAVRSALAQSQPGLVVEIVDALGYCSRWFRAYYNSYEIPLRFWPSLWEWIEGIQHRSKSTGPSWLYRRGAEPLFQFMQMFAPDIVVATEVGLCELAAMHKRENGAAFQLVATELMDFNQAWVQPEVDLYLTNHDDLAAELEAAGVQADRIRTSGHPIDPAFAALAERTRVRKQLQLSPDIPMLLVLFGGSGSGKPERVVDELKKLRLPLQIVFITGRNPRLERRLQELCGQMPRCRVLGWADNISEWMVAADILLSKPGGSTMAEAAACGLPMLALDPLPGNEQRTCRWIEKWGAGYWIRHPSDLLPLLTRLLEASGELAHLRRRVQAVARPQAAEEAAEAILHLWQSQDSSDLRQATIR